MMLDVLTGLAWLYAAGFLGVFLITHAPGFTDAQGYLFGLFKIDPIDDVVHLLSGVAGVVVARLARPSIPAYFKAIGILYGLDAVVGLVLSRGFLDLSIFLRGPGAPDFGLTNIAVNAPHVVIAGVALVIGFSRHFASPVARPA